MAQSAVSAIKSGCQFLSETTSAVKGFKKDAESVVSDARALYKDVSTLWTWIKSLFSTKSKAAKVNAPVADAPVAKAEAVRKGKQSELTYEEYKARSVHDIFENLKVYFETIRQLKQHCNELEAQSSTTEKVADNAIDLIEIRWQMSEMGKQVREAMAWTPEELGLQDLYKQFLATYEDILEQQEFARQLKQKKDRDAKWRQELLRNHRIDRMVQVVTVVGLILWMWGFLLSLRWLGMTQDGSLSGW